MATTIQVSAGTKQLLDRLKQQEEAASYDDVIAHLISSHAKVPKSMFGAARKKMKFTKADRMKFHEL
jgi:hypothetical protein